jgi:WD40 repeat protein
MTTAQTLPKAEASFFTIGGTLPANAPSYIERQADSDLFTHLSAGDFCYVLTSRQMGKSSLMVHTASRLREAGTRVALLDLTKFGQNLTPEQWYDGLLMRLGHECGMEDEVEDFWNNGTEAVRRMGSMQRWMSAVRQIIVKGSDSKIVIFVDEIDAVRGLPFSTDEFFAGIRELYNDRTRDPDLNRIAFCLLGVATPSDLIRNVRTTPFNIGFRVELTDFTQKEAAPFLYGLNRPPAVALKLLQRILWWTGGHPYLTQRLTAAVAADRGAASPAHVDRICDHLFLSSRARETDDNLLFVRERILRSEAALADLLDLYARIHAGKNVPDDDANRLIGVLRLAGLVAVRANRLTVRNRIYEHVFDQRWIRVNMPDAEVRRQRAAFRKGVIRAAGLAVVILAVIAGLIFKGLADQQRVAIESYCTTMIQVQQAFDNGDYASGYSPLREMQLYVRSGPRAAERLLARHPLLNRALSFVLRHQEVYAFLNGFDKKVNAEFEWNYLRARSWGYSAFTYFGPTDEVRSVAISPDGKLAATAGADSTVRIFDISGTNYSSKERPRLLRVLLVRDSNGNAQPISPPAGGGSVDGELMKMGVLTQVQTTGAMVFAPGTSPPGVNSVKFSPDGKWIAIATGSSRSPQKAGDIYLWSTSDPGTVRFVKTHHTEAIDSVVFRTSTDFATTSEDNTAEFFHIEGNAPDETVTYTGNFDASRETARGMNAAAYSPDGRTFAMISGDGHLWIKGRPEPIVADVSGLMSITFYDNTRILLGTRDGRVKLFDLTEKEQKLHLYLDTGQGLVTSVTVSADKNRDFLLTTGSTGTVLVWKILKDEHNKDILLDMDDDARAPGDAIMLSGERDVTYSAAITPDDRLIVSGGSDVTSGIPSGHVYFWMQQPAPSGGVTLTSQPESSRPFTWASQPGYILAAGAVQALAFAPPAPAKCKSDQKYVSPEIGSIRGVSTQTGAPSEIYFTPLDPCTGRPEAEQSVPMKLSNHQSPGTALAWSPDGKFMAVAFSDGTVLRWDAATHSTELLEMATDKDKKNAPIPILGLSFSRDGWLAGMGTAAQGREIFLWRPADSPAIQNRIPVPAGAGTNAASAPQPSGTTQVLNQPSLSDAKATAADHATSAKRMEGSLMMEALDFSRDGRWLAACGSSNTVQIWNAADILQASPNAAAKPPRPVKTLDGSEFKPRHDPSGKLEGQCRTLAFSPNNQWLAAGTINREIAIWFTGDWSRVGGGISRASVTDSKNAKPHYIDTPPSPSAAVNAVAFSPDSQRLAYGTADAKIYLWSVTAQLPLPVLTVHSGGVLTLAFSPDGKCLASGSNDETVRFTCQVDQGFLNTLSNINPNPEQRSEDNYWIPFAQ